MDKNAEILRLFKSAFNDVVIIKANNLIKEKLSQIQSQFPEAQLVPSIQSAANYIQKIGPEIVYTYMICTLGGLKQCSTISPYFAAKASSEGFATLITSKPNHQYNIMLTEEGSLGVDLTRLQFEVNNLASKILEEEDISGKYNDNDPFGENRATQLLKKELIKNPFRTIRIWKTDSIDGVAPSKNALTGDFIRHFNPKLQQTDHPEYGSESDPKEMYELLENT